MDGLLHDGPLHDAPQLGRLLRRWRALCRAKQAHVGTLLGVSQATVSRWENGSQKPDPAEQRALRSLMAARLDGAADAALARLVNDSREPVHLVCDLTHRLLALSAAREAECRLPRSALLGHSLWRYATADIHAAEAQLAARGWFDDAPPALELHTAASAPVQDVPIPASRFRWVRLQLSDGSYARLVETLPPALIASIQSTRSPSAATRR